MGLSSFQPSKDRWISIFSFPSESESESGCQWKKLSLLSQVLPAVVGQPRSGRKAVSALYLFPHFLGTSLSQTQSLGGVDGPWSLLSPRVSSQGMLWLSLVIQRPSSLTILTIMLNHLITMSSTLAYEIAQCNMSVVVNSGCGFFPGNTLILMGGNQSWDPLVLYCSHCVQLDSQTAISIIIIL